jgi:hypothetical protein
MGTARRQCVSSQTGPCLREPRCPLVTQKRTSQLRSRWERANGYETAIALLKAGDDAPYMAAGTMPEGDKWGDGAARAAQPSAARVTGAQEDTGR